MTTPAQQTRKETPPLCIDIQHLYEKHVGEITNTNHQDYLTFQGQVVKLVRVEKRKQTKKGTK